mgnify:CR=1 FL=1
MRPLTAALTLGQGRYVLDGVPRMRERPIVDLVEGLLQYTSAVDVMIQADPTVSALLYGGAKLILQVRLSDSWCTLI